MKIFITGPAGSGKTTQAKMLAEKLGLCYVSGGNVARKKAAEDSVEGRTVKEALEKGELVDNKIEGEAVKATLQDASCRNGYVLDGYPRCLDQFNYFKPDFDVVFYLDVPDEEVTKRLLARGRLDDIPKAIAERLQIFHQETDDVINYFKNLGKVVKIDGSQSPDGVAAEIERGLP